MKTESTTKLNTVDYYKLPNGKVDVFLRKNFDSYKSEDVEVFTCDEKIIQVDKSISKETIENNFEHYWQENHREKTVEEKLEEFELLFNEMLGVINE